MPRCISDVIKESNNLLSKEEAEQIFQSIEGCYKTLNKALGRPTTEAPDGFEAFTSRPWNEYVKLSPAERMRELAKEVFAESLRDKQELLRRQYLQVQTNIGNEVQLAQHAANTGRTRTESLIDFLVGNPYGKGTMESFQSRYKGTLSEFMSRLWPGLDKYMTTFGYKITPEQETSLARELFKLGSTEDSAAHGLAKVWQDVSGDLRERLNHAGADIGHIMGYIPQSWERMKTLTFGLSTAEMTKFYTGDREQRAAVKAKAKEAWLNHVQPLMNREHPKYINRETGDFFNDLEMREFLSNAWDTITTNGLSKKPVPGDGSGAGRSMRASLEAERQLHFKDADAFLEANRAFGSTDVLTALIQTVQQRSKSLALLEKLGPNTNTGFNSLFAHAQHLDAMEPTIFHDKKAGFVQTLFKEVSGSAGSPETTVADLYARVNSAKRKWMTFAKLGSAFLSQVNDLAVFTTMAMNNGMGAGKAIKTAAHYLNPVNKADRAAAQRLGLAVESAIQEVMSRYADTLNGVGKIDKAANFVMTASFMKGWTDSLKTAWHVLTAQHIAMMRNIPFNNLEPSFKQMFQRHGIDQSNWDIIRSIEPVELGGNQLIVPSQIKDQATAIKLFGMFSDEGDIAVLSPDFKERAIGKGATAPGSVWGELRRDMLLFRMFSIGMVSKVLPRVIASMPEGSRYNKPTVAISFVIGSLLAGGLSYQMKEISKGRNPRDVTDLKFWFSAAAQSGGLGIFGDFMFSDLNRFGQSLAETVMGPFWGGTANDFMKLTLGNIRQAAEGKDPHVFAELLKFAKNNFIPNFWYTRAALDHMLFYRLQEMANPGYLERMKERVERENNTSWYWDPQDALPASGPNLGAMIGQ
jgi:hypothetical protein